MREFPTKKPMDTAGLITLDSQAIADRSHQENLEAAEAILAAYEVAERSADAVRADAVASIRRHPRRGAPEPAT
jgi:hypothetical protein